MIENKVSKTNNSIASVNGNSKFGINNSNSNNSKSNTTTTLTAAISASNTNTSTTTTSSPHHQILTSPMKSNIGSVSTNSSGGATNNNNNNNNNSYSACNITQIFQKTILRTEQDFIGQSLENYLQIHGNEHNNRHSPRFNINKDNSPSSSPITNTTTTTTTTSTSSNNTNLLTATTNNNNNNNNNSLSPKINSENGNNNNNSHLSIKVSLSQIKKSFIYILVNMSFCTITNVHDSTITLGPCTDFIEVNECSRLTIISITKGIRIKSSNNISLFLCTNQKPIITSDCSDIKLAPYNTHYPNLEIQINQSKLSTQLLDNQWNNPLIFKSFLPQGNSNNNNESNLNTTSNTTTTTSTTSTTTTTTTTGLNNSSNDLNSSSGSLSSSIGESPSFSNIYKILDPEEFYTFVVPFLIKGKTKSNPCELPSKYLKSLVTKSNAVHKLHKSIQQTNVDNKTKAHLLYLVESKFQEWLKETDNIRQINDLINLKRN